MAPSSELPKALLVLDLGERLQVLPLSSPLSPKSTGSASWILQCKQELVPLLAHPPVPTGVVGPAHLAHTSDHKDIRSVLTVVADPASAQPDTYEGAAAVNGP